MAGLEQAAIESITAGAASWRPEECRFSREHEWARAVGEGVVWVGITEYAAGELGDVVFVSLPQAGQTLGQFDKMGEIESVKAVSDLFAPVSGEVVAANDALLQQPELVNQSSFGAGWMLGVRLAKPSEMDALMDHAAYSAYLSGLSH
ncbi:MAG: glycine cleavage system protein GcvH [Dehalococcoidia bacterium]|nr:glycine cleavage system protein GcvH [Dehalococcoidia bacterium]